MNQEELKAQFDEWAQSYDWELEQSTNSFPFAGYRQVLSLVKEQARVKQGMTVLDLGVGTGNLARLFVEEGCLVVGVDFSPEMLAKTREKLPQVELIQADLTLDEWPDVLNRRFDRIVSNYVFHEFPFATKMSFLTRLARENLSEAGHFVIGDITFRTAADLERVKLEAGDEWEEEYYWLADETREVLEAAGWSVDYIQVSFCAGVYVLEPPEKDI